MVTGERAERVADDAWRGLDRQQRVELALRLGEYEFAEWMKVVGFDEDLTPEWDAEDARVAAERMALGRFVPSEVVEAEMATEFPEDQECFRKMEERFPGSVDQLTRDPYTPDGREFFFMLHEEFPQDLDDYLGDDYFFRVAS